MNSADTTLMLVSLEFLLGVAPNSSGEESSTGKEKMCVDQS